MYHYAAASDQQDLHAPYKKSMDLKFMEIYTA